MAARILLTHSPDALADYYGERALAGLQAPGEVGINRDKTSLAGEALAGVLVTQASAGFVTSVSELVFGLMIDLSRGISAASSAYHSGRTPQARLGRELKGSTLGVIGYGAIGREVVRLGEAFGMRVLVCDPYAVGVSTVPLEQLIAESDYIVPLAVATAETENLIGEPQFSAMKPGACFINASRGNLVDEAALVRALDSGRLGGCALDVGRAPDQMPTPSLAARADVIATPHTAGLTLPAIEHQSMETVAQAAEILNGRAPRGAVNAEHWTRKALLKK